MNKLRIIAGPITHLSDARYFAARGVDMLLYLIDPEDKRGVSPTVYEAIATWVEGPLSVFLVAGESSVHPKGESVRMSTSSDGKKLWVFDSGDEYEELDTIQNFEKSDIPVIVNTSAISVDEAKAHLKNLEQIDMIYLQGGEEEQIGLKSFEELDEWLDLLDEIKRP